MFQMEVRGIDKDGGGGGGIDWMMRWRPMFQIKVRGGSEDGGKGSGDEVKVNVSGVWK